MTVNELLRDLGRLYPQSFAGPEGLEAWGRVYHQALDGFEGAALRAAFDAVIRRWVYPTAPKPGELLGAAEEWRRENAPGIGKPLFGDGADRPKRWAEYVVANSARFNIDANRAARSILGLAPADKHDERHPPSTLEDVKAHIERTIGSITRPEIERIVATWVRKFGEAHVIEIVRVHYRERPLRCIPWIEQALYGPIDRATWRSPEMLAARAVKRIEPQANYLRDGPPAREIDIEGNPIDDEANP